MMKNFLLTFCLIGSITGTAQVMIDDTGAVDAIPETSAVLELKSNNKGLLLPRLAQEPANPVAGLFYFDTSLNCFRGYNGSSWDAIGADCGVAQPTAYAISISDPTDVTEGEGQTFTVSISPALKAGDVITVDYITNETTPVSATEDSDYAGDVGTLTFNKAGQTTQDIVVSTIDDTEVEPTETYSLDLSNATANASATVSISQASATGSILDNDSTVNYTFTETFNNQPISNTTTYAHTETFSGEDGTTWACRARTDLGTYVIDEKGFMFRDINNNYCDVTFPNGIKTLSFDYKPAFTGSGSREITVLKNGSVIGTTGVIVVNANVSTLEPITVNETESVTLRINNAGDKQVVLDNVTWTR